MKILVLILVLAMVLPGCIPRRMPEAQPPREIKVTVVPLVIAEKSTVPYDRKEWRHWTDHDKDCLNTRHEVLEAESMTAVTYTSSGCAVASGRWLGRFTGEVYESARSLDVDHYVPLKNAHQSGGWQWSREKKQEFANDLKHDESLIAVSASANRRKGAKGPENYRPIASYWCEYASTWVSIKSRWELSATAEEWAALEEMLATC
jgi:hypothetical protein